MTTPLDLAALRALTPLEAAQRLTASSRAELWALCELLGARVKARAEKIDLVNAVLGATHPQRAATPRAAARFEQDRFA